MVVKGDFSVRLVEAQSKAAFPEHTHSDGSTFTEVEPNAEYLIEVKMLESAKQNLPQCVRVKFYVDGKYLGYAKYLRPHATNDAEAYYAGARSEHEGITTHQALRFATPTIKFDADTTTTNDGDSRPSFGEVTVKIKECIDTGKKKKKKSSYDNSAPVITAGTISASRLQGEKKKMLRSTVGDYSEAKAAKHSRHVYKSGKRLESFTIRYCTALGLVQAGFFTQQNDTTQADVDDDEDENNDRKPSHVKREASDKENEPTQSEVIDVDDDETKPGIDRKPSRVKREADEVASSGQQLGDEETTVASDRKAKRARGAVSQMDKFVDLSCLSDED